VAQASNLLASIIKQSAVATGYQWPVMNDFSSSSQKVGVAMNSWAASLTLAVLFFLAVSMAVAVAMWSPSPLPLLLASFPVFFVVKRIADYVVSEENNQNEARRRLHDALEKLRTRQDK
jgi:hypothetical protein